MIQTFMKRNKNYYPKASNNVVVRYIERTKLKDQVYPLMEAIVALANTDGGRVFVGRKTKTNGGIPIDLQQEYRNAVMECLGVIRDSVKDFPVEMIDLGWEYQLSESAYLVVYVPNLDKTLYEINWPGKVSNAVFVRENGRTVRLGSSTHSLSSIRKRVKYKILQPAYADGSNYFFINNPKPLDSAYKYMTLEAFILSLHNGTWQFAEPTKWNDEYEGRFYHAKYDDVDKPVECPPKLFATCITGEVASEAAWKVYSHGQGLGSRCVQIKVNMKKLREKLSKQIIKKCKGGNEVVEGTVYEGRVYYDLSDAEIDNEIHSATGAYYHTFFDGFDREKFLKLLLIKRKAYEYEKETRLFIVPDAFSPINIRRRKGKGETIQVIVDWKYIIEEIRIDKKCSDGEKASIKYALDKAGITYREVKKKDKKMAGEIPLLLFNVDEMEGTKSIKIAKAKKV